MCRKESFRYYIDKTDRLEEGIGRFPSIFIEGNAAVGKTTAVRMLLEKHPDISGRTFDMQEEIKHPELFADKLYEIAEFAEHEKTWIIFENIPEQLPAQLITEMKTLIRTMSGSNKVLMVSRERPQTELLDLLWKGSMELVTAEDLCLSLEEVILLGELRKSPLNGELVFEKTGGWAGCADLVYRMSHQKKMQEVTDPEECILRSYEVRSYIEKEMIAILPEEEQSLLRHAAGCPWLEEDLCLKAWGIDASEMLEKLTRKGFLTFDQEKGRWMMAPLFGRYIDADMPAEGREDVWYETHNALSEALECLERIGAQHAYEQCLLKHYDKISRLGILSDQALQLKEKDPRACYLRGICYYQCQNLTGLQKEIAYLQKIKEKDHRTREILLNLLYLDPQITLEEWMIQVKKYTEDGSRFWLYQMLGGSVTYLCGLRDLSGLFCCSSKEEKQFARLWKEAFGAEEWECYLLAKADYYLETDRKQQIEEEIRELLRKKGTEEECWQFQMARFYLLRKMAKNWPEEIEKETLFALEHELKKEKSNRCAERILAVNSLYGESADTLTSWLREPLMNKDLVICEENHMIFFCRAKRFMKLKQYDRAENILKKLIPYLQTFHRHRAAAETLFQYAVIHYEKGMHSQAIKDLMESFIAAGHGRYVRCYLGYGQSGRQVLEAYCQWLYSSRPEAWSRKKKYNYGNVLRMPMEDYLQVILREMKKASKYEKGADEEKIKEQLTMMETVVLQAIGRGMSNREICEELNLKLPTVKGHIYNMYKKLGVSSRVQAANRGKELGILE